MNTYIIKPNMIRDSKPTVLTLNEVVNDTMHGYSDGRQEGCLNPAEYSKCSLCDGTGIDDDEPCEDCNGTGDENYNLCDGCVVCCDIVSALDDPNAYVTSERADIVQAARDDANFTRDAWDAATADGIDPSVERRRAEARKRLAPAAREAGVTNEDLDTYIDELTYAQAGAVLYADDEELEALADTLAVSVYRIEREYERNDNSGSESEFLSWQSRPTRKQVEAEVVSSFDHLTYLEQQEYQVTGRAVVPVIDSGDGVWATLPVKKGEAYALYNDCDNLIVTVNAGNVHDFND